MQTARENDRKALSKLIGGYAPTEFRLMSRVPLSVPHPAMRADRLTLESPTGEKVRGFLTGPDAVWQDCPAVLLCHAHGNRYAIGASELLEGRPALQPEPYGAALARLGIVALCIDMPCFGERATVTESALAKRLLWRGEALFGHMLNDLGGAMTVLAGLDGVDPARIGVLGLSMGATQAFWLAALDPRPAAIAHLCCFADLDSLIASGGHDLHGLYMLVPGLTRAVSTGGIAGLAAPRPQLACMGLLDPLTPSEAVEIGLKEARAAYAAASAKEALEVLISPDTGHVETPAMRAAVLAFLDKRLKQHQGS